MVLISLRLAKLQQGGNYIDATHAYYCCSYWERGVDHWSLLGINNLLF